MGELMFQYTVSPEFRHELMFKYLHSRSIENSFAYQRYIALSDASVFNNPVAITKVAAGFIDLHDLFVDKVAHPVIYYNNLKSAQSRIDFTPNVSLDIFGMRPNRDFNHPLPIIFGERPVLVLNKQDIIFGEYHKTMGIDNSGLYMFMDNSKFSIYQEQYNGQKEWRFTPWTDVLMGNRGEIIGNHYKQYGMWYDDRIVNLPYQDMMSWRDRLGFNILPMFFGKPFDKHGNHNPILFGKTDRNGFNILPMFNAKHIPEYDKIWTSEGIFAYKDNATINYYDNIYMSVPGKIANFNKTNAATVYTKHTNYYHMQGPVSVPVNRGLNTFPFYGAYIKTKTGDKFVVLQGSKSGYQGHVNNIASFIVNNKFGHIMSQNTVYAYGQSAGYLSLDNFCITTERYLGLADNISVSLSHKNVSIPDSGISTQIAQKALTYTPTDAFIDTIIKNVFNTNDSVFVQKLKTNAQYTPTDVFSSLYLKPTSTENEDVFVQKTKHNMFLEDTETFIYKMPKEINTLITGLFVDKSKHGMFINDSSTFIYKLAKDLHTLHDKAFDGLWSSKVPGEISLRDNVFVYKMSKKLHDLIDNVFISKLGLNISLDDTFVGLNKELKDVMIFRQGVHALKGRIIAKYDNDFEGVIKGCHDTNFFGTGNYRGLMIPVSKVKRQVFIDRIDNMVYKLHKHLMINQSEFATVLPKQVAETFPDLFCDKDAHKVYIEYKNIFIIKDKIRTTVFEDEFVAKVGREINVYDDQDFAYKVPYDVWILEDFSGTLKKHREITVHEDIGALKYAQELSIYDNVFIDKDSQICYYDYGQWAEKAKYNIAIQQQEMAYHEQRDIHILDLTSAIKPNNDMYVNKIYHAEIIKNASLYQQIEEIHRMYYHCGIRPEDFGNWVWVYETPDPFEKDPFGIDELLLPERDTRYEDFESIIFDKEKMKPKNPVKKIDDTTFIAKYPHKHPIPEYSDIGIDYDASAIKVENYYGIQTSIMHTIFLKYYRIWQSKLFEFSTMTMQQSVKLMLEYIYSWIMIYFPPEELEQALRVFRLIRWYGESAIITNSQYIISYEYEDLKSKLTNGTCAIPNDVDPDENGYVANPTMYVDAANGVIRNNPTLIGSSDAYVNFTINIKKNSTFSFSLRNTVGSVNIYIDNVLVDTVSSSQLLLSYPLNYTGRPITVRIIKTRANNLNHLFCIGNITVADGSFKDLSIEFDPTLKAGNKPLDEIAKKMLQYANEYDSIQEAYEVVRKANLGVSETYKKMVEYWKLHHEDKIKGKRLTIKEV